MDSSWVHTCIQFGPCEVWDRPNSWLSWLARSRLSNKVSSAIARFPITIPRSIVVFSRPFGCRYSLWSCDRLTRGSAMVKSIVAHRMELGCSRFNTASELLFAIVRRLPVLLFHSSYLGFTRARPLRESCMMPEFASFGVEQYSRARCRTASVPASKITKSWGQRHPLCLELAEDARASVMF